MKNEICFSHNVIETEKSSGFLLKLSKVFAICLESIATSLGLRVLHTCEWAELKLTGLFYSFVTLSLSALLCSLNVL